MLIAFSVKLLPAHDPATAAWKEGIAGDEYSPTFHPAFRLFQTLTSANFLATM